MQTITYVLLIAELEVQKNLFSSRSLRKEITTEIVNNKKAISFQATLLQQKFRLKKSFANFESDGVNS